MAQLEFLYLESNKIEKIASNTFEDLTALKEIDLSKNCCLFFIFSLIYVRPGRSQPNQANQWRYLPESPQVGRNCVEGKSMH